MFSSISARYDLANHILSLELDRGWRRRLVKWADPHPTEKVLDLCTGTADLLVEFAHDRQGLILWGLDLSREMLTIAQKKFLTGNSSCKILFVEGNALQLPYPSKSLDVITIAFGLRNLPDIQAGLLEMVRVLKPGGRLLILEFALPPNRLWRSLYLFYLKYIVPRLGAFLSGSPDAYEYLHDSIRSFPPPPEIMNHLRLAGLARIENLPLAGGIAVIYRGEKVSN